jgi:hypothetical protein
VSLLISIFGSELDDEWRARLKQDEIQYFRTADYFAMEGRI